MINNRSLQIFYGWTTMLFLVDLGLVNFETESTRKCQKQVAKRRDSWIAVARAKRQTNLVNGQINGPPSVHVVFVKWLVYWIEVVDACRSLTNKQCNSLRFIIALIVKFFFFILFRAALLHFLLTPFLY